MGRELASAYPEAKRVFAEADEILGFPLSRLAWGGAQADLTLTKNAQPALLTHSVAAHEVARDRIGPVAIGAGHSLGEFSAYVVAGALTFEDALRAVRLRGELMFASGQDRPGTMAAVLGLDDATIESVCRTAADESDACVPANFNSAGQVVISGDCAAVERAMGLLKEAGAMRVLPLNVSGAFHSPLMAPAREELREHLESVDFADPAFPVVSNVTAEPVTSGVAARDLLVEQLTSPVRWAGSIQAMLDYGVSSFMELGPGSVLCGLNRRNARGVPCQSVGEPAQIDTLSDQASRAVKS